MSKVPYEMARATSKSVSPFHLTELDSQLMFVQKSPFPAFEKGGNRKSPFVKGDLEGFSPAQHHFDETLMKWRGSLTAKSAGDSADS